MIPPVGKAKKQPNVAARATIAAAIIGAVALLGVAVFNKFVNPSNPPSPQPTATATSPTSGSPTGVPLGVVIDIPQERSAVGYPTQLTGHVNGTLPSGSSIWGASAGGDLVHSLNNACRVEQQSFDCGTIYLGRPEISNTPEMVCVYVVSDSAQFDNYASRPNLHQFPGFDLDPQPVLTSDCNAVTRQ